MFPGHQSNSTEQKPIRSAAVSEIGQSRKTNEDAVFQKTVEVNGKEFGLYMVCDGMGGLEAGDVASRTAVETIAAVIEQEAANSDQAAVFDAALKSAIIAANNQIRRMVGNGQAEKMGTTVTAAIVYENTAVIAHIGDSRCYLWRDGEMQQLTADHTMVNEMVSMAIITPDQALTHPMRHILTKAVGSKGSLDADDIDTFQITLQPGDRLLICSDGLWGAFAEGDDLAAAVAQESSPEDCCWHLVDEANERDGSDNISAVAVFVEE